MKENSMIQARRRAEQAVKDMADGPLKVAAFEVILSKLLGETDTEQARQPKASKQKPRGRQTHTLKGRILAIRAEGFFDTQRALRDIAEALGSRGWHYPITTLSGAMQALVQAGELRRVRVNDGQKRFWKYSNP